MTFPNKVFETLSEHEILIYVRTYVSLPHPTPPHPHSPPAPPPRGRRRGGRMSEGEPEGEPKAQVRGRSRGGDPHRYPPPQLCKSERSGKYRSPLSAPEFARTCGTREASRPKGVQNILGLAGFPWHLPDYSINVWQAPSSFGGVSGSSRGNFRFRGVSVGAAAVSDTRAQSDPDVEAEARAGSDEAEAEAEGDAEADGGAPPQGSAGAGAGANDEGTSARNRESNSWQA